jgi:Family of unknown function (DUF5999)
VPTDGSTRHSGCAQISHPAPTKAHTWCVTQSDDYETQVEPQSPAADQRSNPMCKHDPACPSPDAPDREAAATVATHPEQGWSLLCNGIVLFEDTGELLPDGQVIAPHRPTDRHPEAFGHALR